MADDGTRVAGRADDRTDLWARVYHLGVLLAALAAVPYALVVAATPLEPSAPAILHDLGVPSATTLARALTAVTCGVLAAAAVGAAVVVRRLAPPWTVLTAGVAALSAGALWVRSVDGVGQLAAVRGLQGVGAGCVLVASPALLGTVVGRARRMLSAAWLVAVLAGCAALPWATYRLPFVARGAWQDVVAPYPAVLMVALAATAAVAVPALVGRAAVVAGDDQVDDQAGRLGWPLVLPAGIGAAAYLLDPGWGTAAGHGLTLRALLLLTTVTVVVLAGMALVRTAGWQAAATPSLVVVLAVVVTVVAANALHVALFADARWPLPAAHVLPALGGATLAGAAAVVAAVVSPHRVRRPLAVVGLLAAAAGVLLQSPGGLAVTAVGTVLVWAGAGLAAGAVVRWTGVAGGGWTGAAFVSAATLTGIVSSTLRDALTPSTPLDAADTERLAALREGFADARWIVVTACVLLLAGAAAAVARWGGGRVAGEGGVERPSEPAGEAPAGEAQGGASRTGPWVPTEVGTGSDAAGQPTS